MLNVAPEELVQNSSWAVQFFIPLFPVLNSFDRSACLFLVSCNSHCIVDSRDVIVIRLCSINTLLSSKQPCDWAPLSTLFCL